MSESRICAECGSGMAETDEFWHCNLCDHHIKKQSALDRSERAVRDLRAKLDQLDAATQEVCKK